MSVKKEVKYIINKGRVRATYYPENNELGVYTRTLSDKPRAIFDDFKYVMKEIAKIRGEVL